MIYFEFYIKASDNELAIEELNNSVEIVKLITDISNGKWIIKDNTIVFDGSLHGDLSYFFIESCIYLAANVPSVTFTASADYQIESRNYEEHCSADFDNCILNINTDCDGCEENYSYTIKGSKSFEDGYVTLKLLDDVNLEILSKIILDDPILSYYYTIDNNSIILKRNALWDETIFRRMIHYLKAKIREQLPTCAYSLEGKTSSNYSKCIFYFFTEYFDYYETSWELQDSSKNTGQCIYCGNEVVLPREYLQNHSYNCVNCGKPFRLRCLEYPIEDHAPDGYRENENSLIIPNGITRIPAKAYNNRPTLTTAIFPNTLLYIGPQAFSGCDGLKSVIIPDSVVELGFDAFANCKNLESIKFSRSANVGSCSGCNNLKDVIIPYGVRAVDGSAFYGCSSLKAIDLPETLISIGGYAFVGCDQLTLITIPASVKFMDDTRAICSRECVLHILKGSVADKYARKQKCHVKRYTLQQ